MIWKITKKDLLLNVMTFKFLAGAMTLAVPLTMAFLVAILMLSFSPAVDLTGVPKFEDRDHPFSQSRRFAIWDTGALILFNVLFFTGSFISFLRYDAR